MAETGENELAAIDFLFDLNTMYGAIGHRFDARNYYIRFQFLSTVQLHQVLRTQIGRQSANYIAKNPDVHGIKQCPVQIV